MSKFNLDFSVEQLKFLALLKIFNEPVKIDIIGTIVPLLPGPFMELLDKAVQRDILNKPENGFLSLKENLNKKIETYLNKVIDKNFISEVLEQIYKQNLHKKLDKKLLVKLHEMGGNYFKAANIYTELAHDAVKENRFSEARRFLEKSVKKLFTFNNLDKDAKLLFISSSLELSNLNFVLGTGFHEIDKFLIRAQEYAGEIGDTRSHALTNLHLGRLYYFTDRRDEALIALSLGHQEIKDIGDNDIIIQSAVFLGIFYVMKGLLNDAIKYFEKAENAIETGKTSILKVPTAPLFLGYCAIYLGEFHKALGNLDYYWRKAKEQFNISIASTYRAGLGTVLALLKKFKEAEYHLNHAREDALKYNNALAAYFCGGSLALINYLNGKIDSAYEILKDTVKYGTDAGLYRQFTSPWILEMIYEFERQGFEPLPYFKFSELKEIIINGMNIHLQGVCYRLIAQESMVNGEDKNKVKDFLIKSKKLLMQSGDRLELSKTIFDLAKLELIKENLNEAKTLIYKGRRLLSGYIDEFFPIEFNNFIDKAKKTNKKGVEKENFLKNYLEVIESLYPLESKNEIFHKLLSITTDLFGAERSGLFTADNNTPKLKTSYNLSNIEVKSKKFNSSLLLIQKTFKSKKPEIGKKIFNKNKAIKSVFCMPIKVGNSVKAVIYYDNLYLDNAFDFLDLTMIEQLSKHIGLIIERRFNYIKVKEERDILSLEKEFNVDKDEELIVESEIMVNMLDKVDKVAKSDSTILIIGETGTGKELIAKRIHEKSSRKKYPFIVVDCTTIPENLIESELFGHEKGAFTGADKRKIGRIELAHNGTLFVDELGELSLNAQTKLLRVLQERQFTRVGGTQIIDSNFRLIAATNRNLKQEVKEGRFREDLFYRLNVIPVYVPPLRERKEDIPLIAKHFIEYYSHKYSKTGLKLTYTQEKLLMEYPWPGNVRELKNVIERAVLLSDHNKLNIELFPKPIDKDENPFGDLPTLKELEKRYIIYVLKKTNGKIGGKDGAAEILGLKRTTLYSKMKILGMNEYKYNFKN